MAISLVEQAEFPKDEAIHYIELEYGLNLEMIHEGKQVKHVFSHVIWVVYPIFAAFRTEIFQQITGNLLLWKIWTNIHSQKFSIK